MSSQRILKFVRTGNNNDQDFVLVSARQSGKKPLDLKLIGTDNEAAYVAILRQDRIAALKANQAPLSNDEWRNTLEGLFTQQPQSGVKATATVEQGKIIITLRKEIQGFTQRLGAINLDADEKALDSIDLFEWCSLALDSSSEAQCSLQDSLSKQESLETEVKDLESQLDELVTAKDRDETILLQKFRDLLNEKKVKIREQQKIIAASSFKNSEAAEEPAEASSPPLPARKPAASRAGKRKAPAKATKKAKEEDQIPSEDDMDVDIKAEPEDSDPGNTTEATASTASDDDEPPASSAPKSPVKAASPSQKPTTMPAKRDLPFNSKKPATRAALVQAPVEDETDSEDEL